MKRILVIEDEPSVVENITYALSTEGFDAIGCSTGHEGLAALAERDIDLIVLDIGLPDVNGFEICKEIRKTSNVPIIFLTARVSEIDRVVGLEIGGDDYVVKPFSPRELTARVKAILRRCAEPDDSLTWRVDDERSPFTVDDERCTICFRGTPLALTRYEYRILEILIRRPGRVFSREILMELAWEEPTASMERTIDAHIRSIRSKLRASGAQVDVIRTHRGFGYSLRDDW
jgi:two-component system catabolic regulation response regulator CreB